MTNPKPVAWRLFDEDPSDNGPSWVYYDASEFKEGVIPNKYFPKLQPLYDEPRDILSGILNAAQEAGYCFVKNENGYKMKEIDKPISVQELFEVMRGIDPTTQKIPEGILALARAIEARTKEKLKL